MRPLEMVSRPSWKRFGVSTVPYAERVNPKGMPSALVAAHPGNQNRVVHGAYSLRRELPPEAEPLVKGLMALPHVVAADWLAADADGEREVDPEMKSILAIAIGFAVLASAAVATASLARITFSDGTYRVPQDISPGTYRTRGGDSCYWARLKNFSGTLDGIRANAIGDGPAVVTILRSDRGFETQRCGNWTRNLARITSSKTRFGEGTFIVGTDIAPGTYRSSRGNDCYWARLRNFTGDLNAIIANDIGGRAIVTINRSDKGFHSQRCGTWTRT